MLQHMSTQRRRHALDFLGKVGQRVRKNGSENIRLRPGKIRPADLQIFCNEQDFVLKNDHQGGFVIELKKAA